MAMLGSSPYYKCAGHIEYCIILQIVILSYHTPCIVQAPKYETEIVIQRFVYKSANSWPIFTLLTLTEGRGEADNDSGNGFKIGSILRNLLLKM